jgi:tetratricopeptide (TPR) repeat protein
MKQKETLKTINPNSTKKLKSWLGIIIASFAIILYAQSVRFSYACDDETVIVKNKITKQGFAGIPKILKTDYWYGYKDELRVPEYRPSSLIIYAIIWQLSPDSPDVYHFINVLAYALTCLVLFLVLCRMFKKHNLIFPFVCSLLYVAHPIHTEVVNYIKSLDEILCFLFGLIAILFILKYIVSKSNISLIISGLSFFLSLLSKETGITFLIIIPLIIYFFTESRIKKTFSIAGLYIVFTGIYFIIRMIVLKDMNHTINNVNYVLNNSLNAAPDFVTKEATAFYILLRYVILLVIPHPLSSDYSFAQIKIQSLSDVGAIAGILIYFAFFIYALINFRKKNIIAFGILFYLITLAPVSNVFLTIGATMAERFMYIPSLGFCIVFTYILIKLTKTDSIKNRFKNLSEFIVVNKFLFTLVFGITILYSIKTFSRSGDWKDNLTLFGQDVKTSDNSSRLHSFYGNTLLTDEYPKEKNKAKQMVILDSSIVELNKAIAIYPKSADYYKILGTDYEYKNDYPNAIKNYRLSCLHSASFPIDIMKKLGSLYVLTKQYDNAIDILDTVLKRQPDEASYVNKGSALFNKGKYQDAIAAFDKAIELNPKLITAYQNAGAANINLKQYPEALKYLNKAEELNPQDINTISNLLLVYKQTSDKDKVKEYSDRINSVKEGGKK